MTRWIEPEPVSAAALRSLEVAPMVREMLARRGLHDEAGARDFLHPESIASTPFPGALPMAEEILAAVAHSEPIGVWGDFDADGQTSTTVLVQALRSIGALVSYHVPSRHTEGHGVHIGGLQHLLGSGIRLVLTCDTGSTAHEALAWAGSQGMRILVTDHHDLDDALPDAQAILNPKMLEATHPLADLSGVGVAYKLAELILELKQQDPSPLLDLVAVGLIADVALLRGETRMLAHRGIEVLRGTKRIGLRSLAEMAAADLQNATEETIGYSLAPRLNSLGRLGDAGQAVELLLTDDSARATALAREIEALNSTRRLLAEQVHQAAEDRLISDPALSRQPLLLLEHPEWPGGVLGIVASRLVEKYRKPVLLLSRADGGVWRGSARSIEGLHITRAISENRHLLLNFGGHPMAAGLSLEDDMLASFRRAMQKTVERMLVTAQIQEAALRLDAWIPLSGASLELAEDLEQLAPFGAGNPAPLLASPEVQIMESAQVGRSREHRRLTVVDTANTRAQMLWWSAGDAEVPGGKIDIAYSLRPNAFRGNRTATLTLVDWRMHEVPAVVMRAPEIQVLDFRQEAPPPLSPDSLLWAEGTDVKSGVDRLHLREAASLVIWTSPPSRADLRTAILTVRPRRVVLVARSPDLPSEAQGFLERLAGLAKFSLNSRAGKASVTSLAAACAQRDLAVRLGLEWLAASGHLGLSIEGDAVQLTSGNSQSSDLIRSELFSALRSALHEAAAYRRYFATAPVQQLLRQIQVDPASKHG